jgi:hypothetical protein
LTSFENCAACGARHSIKEGTWVMLASGDLICANDTCWRVMRKWYKEKTDAEKMDEGSAGGSKPPGDGVLGEGES